MESMNGWWEEFDDLLKMLNVDPSLPLSGWFLSGENRVEKERKGKRQRRGKQNLIAS
jgi:hypothetical protein